MAEKIKPCPFCGVKGELRTALKALVWQVVCPDCGCTCRKWFDIQEEAIEAWNRRSDNGRE